MERSLMVLPIYLADVAGFSETGLSATNVTPFSGAENFRNFFAPTGRWLLNALLASLSLSKEDVVTILTTTQDTYISTCVSVTAFNHCGISRVITSQTRVAVIVHEFGYAYPAIKETCERLRRQGIIIIEDCAHVLGLTIENGLMTGSFGDYTLYSLPKVLPVHLGGLLRTVKNFILPPMTSDEAQKTHLTRTAFERTLPFWESLNVRRLLRHRVLVSHCGQDRVIVPTIPNAPWFTYIRSNHTPSALVGKIEFGATLRNDIVLVPTNPMVDEAVFEEIGKIFEAEI
jgi:hypothetical protein